MVFGEGSAHSFILQQLQQLKVLLNLKRLQLHSGVKGSKNCQVLCADSAARARNTLINSPCRGGKSPGDPHFDFTAKVVDDWHRLPKEIVEPFLLEILST